MKRQLLMISLLSLGCNQNLPPQMPTQTATQAPASSPEPTAPAHAQNVEGKVAERIDVESYTYLRLSTGHGETWAAVPSTPVKVGATVQIANPMPIENFRSKSLNRTFDRILFGTIATAPAPTSAATPRFVSKASGPDARTVAEVYRDRATLKDKSVSVHGLVVKVSTGILGHNWIHLRDGSGSEDSQNHDLVVTTTQDVQPEEEVTARGTVHLDKDLGSGYRFSVLVEDAKITRP
ncbi:nucleotide-binding protein [bacterium]|nr:nucleotide-binding protein [bacterium]